MSDDAAVAHQGPRAACQPCRDFHAGKSDIQAEVERLRAKLDEVRQLCDSWVLPPRSGMYVGVITDYRAAVDQCQRAVRKVLDGE